MESQSSPGHLGASARGWSRRPGGGVLQPADGGKARRTAGAGPGLGEEALGQAPCGDRGGSLFWANR